MVGIFLLLYLCVLPVRRNFNPEDEMFGLRRIIGTTEADETCFRTFLPG
jgi:hypothetical protein